MALPSSASPLRWALFVVGGIVLAMLAARWLGPDRTVPPGANLSRADAGGGARVRDSMNQEAVHAQYTGSESCRDCHTKEFDLWAESHHAQAERRFDPEQDRRFFEPSQTFSHGEQTSQSLIQGEICKLLTSGFDGERKAYPVGRVFAYEPLRQFLIAAPGGRYQVTELAVDPERGDWFDVYGDEDRQPGEWGHWTGRGMNWNSMCAACHNTRVFKNYDETTDTYTTAMAEMGVGCEACHGPMRNHVDWQRNPEKVGADPTLVHWTTNQVMETCASCHSRRAELTGDFHPGERYLDHYLPSIPDETDIYHADGQVRDEDFVYVSFLSSRMHAAGVTCADCHNMHSMKVLAPDDSLCMRCHAGGVQNAPSINVTQHSFHKPGTSGSKCVDCHMPETTYMQRDPRRDHGFTIPDPLLTIQHGIPNACNRCHKDKDAAWSLRYVDEWYGEKMDRPYRARARLIALARAGDEAAIPGLIKLAGDKSIPLWRASAASVLGLWAGMPAVNDALLAGLKDTNALVRAKAVRSLDSVAEFTPSVRQAVEPLLRDSVRAVRIEAAWVLRRELDTNSVAGRDLLAFMSHNADQPTGAYQQGIFHLDRGDVSTAADFLRRAVSWDPHSAPLQDGLAVVLSMQGRVEEAVEALQAACRLAPRQAEFRYRLGLALNELGDLPGATTALQEATEIDPELAPAWYNLGLAHSAAGQTEQAINALMRAESLEPNSPRPAYALATVLARVGRTEEARAAARRVLQIDPNHAEAANLLRMLSR